MPAARSIRATSKARCRAASSQGIGWALHEEYIYDKNGHMDNPGFLDYRMPVASDLPMIDTVIIEVPNEKHPQGVRGVGEVPIVPPLAAVANAIHMALGLRFDELPMSPPKVRKALKMAAGHGESGGGIVRAGVASASGKRRDASSCQPTDGDALISAWDRPLRADRARALPRCA